MHVRLVVLVLGRGVAGVLWQAVIELAVEQVELQLEGHHRADAAFGQALDHAGQHFAGLELDRLGGAVGGDEHLRDQLFFPAHRFQGTRHQAPGGIRIAVGEAVVANRVEAALGAQQHAVLRQLQRRAGGDFFQHVDGVALAVEVPGDIQRNQVDITYFWVFRSERAHFSQQIRKDDTHLLVLVR
ncbi:hypothetical protein D3C81_1224540 [compost metagenome]